MANGLFVSAFSLLWPVGMGYSIGSMIVRGSSLVRRRLWCPAIEREADVEFLARDGVPYEVNQCSILGGFGINCGKRRVEMLGQAS